MPKIEVVIVHTNQIGQIIFVHIVHFIRQLISLFETGRASGL